MNESEQVRSVRDVLDEIASGVHVDPGAYHQVRAEWVRRQRRRRRRGVVLAGLVIAVADVIGLWALGRPDDDRTVIFDQHEQPHSTRSPAPVLGQP